MQPVRGSSVRKERFPVEIDAVVHRTDGTRFQARVSNFSDQGCRIATDRDVHIGERLQIAVPHIGEVRTQVRWALPGAAGTRFLTESDF
ncbi:MAG TPA: PilZ domain-containing protein [Sphingomicrobium sp.]|nr:PilZ domain-containing protein [Sphingomicrobium sp.]